VYGSKGKAECWRQLTYPAKTPDTACRAFADRFAETQTSQFMEEAKISRIAMQILNQTSLLATFEG
jgi:hypothetical protein